MMMETGGVKEEEEQQQVCGHWVGPELQRVAQLGKSQ